MSADGHEATLQHSGAPAEAGPDGPPVVVEARGVGKTFRIPDQRLDTLKERLMRPNARRSHETLQALDDVSFDVMKGEFFGIVGRNGSGKSSLLKILSSIYRADTGSVRIAGRVAPFIELGVGFNPELSARENIQLNGVLMGLPRREAIRRLDAILEFAGLERFVDLKVKNFSSGMMVRLAFSIMVQADASILFVDEVLAVGDAAFAKRCMEIFEERRAAGTTIVLVTHDMATVRSMCDRAMLLESGRVVHVGNPEEVAQGYARLNEAEGRVPRPEANRLGGAGSIDPQEHVAVVSASVGEGNGGVVAAGSPIDVTIRLRAQKELLAPRARLQFRERGGGVVFLIEIGWEGPVQEGGITTISGAVDARLVPGSYFLDCWIENDLDDGRTALQAVRLASFEVEGAAGIEGMVMPEHSLVAEVDAR